MDVKLNKFLWEKPPTEPWRISCSAIHVWKADLDQIDNETGQSLVFLFSEEEKRRLNAFKFEKDRFRYAVTHGMKRLIIAHYLSGLPEKIMFISNKQGKPAIALQQNWLKLEFNITHSHRVILIAITIEEPIGIDIEYHSERIPIENLSNIIFSLKEKVFFSKLANQEEKTKAFFRCWTRKEAYLKAKGCGLTSSLNNLSVDMTKFPTKAWLKNLSKESITWKLFPLNIDKLYTATAVSTSCKEEVIHYSFLDQEILNYL